MGFANPEDYGSKGFYEPKTVQDFPIRGKAVYLVFKRRRWRHNACKHETVCNDYSFVAEGSKITRELSDFLKIQVETRRDTIGNIASYYAVKGDVLRRHYKKKSSGSNEWEQKEHAEDYLIFPENIGRKSQYRRGGPVARRAVHVCHQQGRQGQKGSMVALVKDTLSADIIGVLEKLPREGRV